MAKLVVCASASWTVTTLWLVRRSGPWLTTEVTVAPVGSTPSGPETPTVRSWLMVPSVGPKLATVKGGPAGSSWM